MSLTAFLLFLSVYAIAVATPGPGVAAVVARTFARGTAGAFPFVLGFVVGDLIWFGVAAAGLSVIAKSFAPLFVTIKYAGCAYLIWLAFQLWRAEPVLLDEGAEPPAESAITAFLGSLFLTLGNPKVMIFFLSIMPLVVKPEEISWAVALELAVVIAVVISSIMLGYIALANRARQLFRSKRAIGLIQKANAGVLAGAAAAIATR
ncbi:MAG: LysE family translocator [Rhizobiales bacterium]|nr:LysE family translocator [Hyphomicrobiales bacterium]